MSATDHAYGPDTESGHYSAGYYFGVFLALAVLTLVNISISFTELGPWNLVLNLGIAGVQATILALFFMHLKDSDRMTWLITAAGLFWLGILFILVLTDYFTRHYAVL